MNSPAQFGAKSVWLRFALIAAISVGLASLEGRLQGQRPAPQGYITGVVRSSQGPEAGVWVIAETKDLPTNFIKIVVTDDQGRFMVPELPNASYSVWVRGYGLVDSTSDPDEARHESSVADGGSRQNASGGCQGLSG